MNPPTHNFFPSNIYSMFYLSLDSPQSRVREKIQVQVTHPGSSPRKRSVALGEGGGKGVREEVRAA